MSPRRGPLRVVREGNPAHRRLRTPPKPAPRAPTAPDWLPRAAKAEWRRVVKELDALGMIGVMDRAAIAAYALAWARWRQAEELIDEEGLVVKGHRGAARKNPAAQLARDYLAAMLRWARELGLTPASRQGLDAPPVPDPDNPFDC